MNVRWKPLLILSGLFACTALAGVAVWIFGFGPGSGEKPEAILAQARIERQSGQMDRALIQYRRALQASGGTDPAIHEEIASMHAESLKTATADQKNELQLNRFRALAEAARLDRRRIEPRRILMQEALAAGEEGDALRWAEELVSLDPKDLDAAYLMAEKFLDRSAQDLNKARRYIDQLGTAQPESWRVALLKSELNRESNQGDANAATFTKILNTPVDSAAPQSEQVAWARLRLMVVEAKPAKTVQTADVAALRTALEPILLKPEPAVNYRVEWTRALQKTGQMISDKADSKPVIDQVNLLVENALKQALDTNKTDLRLKLALAQHLMASSRYEACIAIVDEALKLPEAKQPAAQRLVFGLRDLAVKSLLANAENKERFNQSEPHIQAMLAAKPVDIQGLGHLFQGSIDLERSGIGAEDAVIVQPKAAPEATGGTEKDAPKVKTADDYRRSAMSHLKAASAALPDVATAHALYGVSLILNREPELGRQSLQKALKLGIPEVRYQVWTAWSQVMAGYPEDAQPIVQNLLTQAETDPNTKLFQPTLYLLLGEIYQARNTPESLQLAYQQYAKALSGGKDASSAVHLRVAQLEMLLRQSDRANARLEALSKNKDTAAAADQLRVLSLVEKGDLAQARKLLAEARKNHPESVELVLNEGGLLVRENKPEEAVKVLADFSAKRPEVIEVVQYRAQIMAERMNQITEARKLLTDHLVKNPNSSLQAQLAQLAITARDFPAAQQGITKLRAQWPDAASADMLTAQLSLAQNNMPGALAGFQAAVKKDPNNKVAQFWLAQIEARLGAVASASQTLQKLVNESPTKQIDSGLSLMSASQTALATIEIDAGQADAAIARLEGVIRTAQTQEYKREAQWQIVAAYASKRDWARMDQVLSELISVKNVTPDEIVRAANYRRSAGKPDQALAMVDSILKTQPTHSGSAALKGFILADRKQYDEAAAVVSQAMKGDKPPISLALLLAALENGRDPVDTRLKRAEVVLNEALAKNPDSVELIKAIFSLRRGSESKEAMVSWVETVITEKSPAPAKRLKAQILASEGEPEKADTLYAELIMQSGQDLTLAMERLQAMRGHASRLDDVKDKDKIRALNTQLDQLVATYRGKFSTNPEIFAFEAELAAERGQADRAIEISRKIDAMNPTSPLGPLVRIRVLMPRRQWPDIIKNMEDAIARDPRRRDLRLQLAGIYAEQGRSKDAVTLVDQLLAIEPDQVDTVLLKARLMVQAADDKTRPVQALAALKLLEPIAVVHPDTDKIYEEAASLARIGGRSDMAAQWLERGLTQKPDDPALASLLIENGADQPNFKELIATWSKKAESDKTGRLALAISVALQRASDLPGAIAMARQAVAKADSPGSWLNQAGILLAMAETAPESQRKALFEESIASYDKVISKAPDAVEAVNNKAWILHHHLGRHQSAAEVVDAYLKRADPARVPADFDDTVGAIRESVAESREAEKAYASGLAKSPNHPVLNFHMGRLLSRDPGRRSNATTYLQKALAMPDRLDDGDIKEARRILAELQPKTGAPLRAN